jgi:predicted nucleotidyltransferase component of viral defense system
MLSMEQILSFFPNEQRFLKRNILREYLQYKILEKIFSLDEGRKITFLGGTAIHIVHGNPRFSEDLDFDNRGISMEDFSRLGEKVCEALTGEGFSVNLDMNTKGNFRGNLRFIGLLQAMEITGHREEKLLIHIEAEPQNFTYKNHLVMLNRFGVFCRINTVTADILLAQKIGCILQRPRAIGRNFYDAIFLWGKVNPNTRYLALKTGVTNATDLWNKLEARCAEISFENLSKDLEPFVTSSSEARKILFFREFLDHQRKLPLPWPSSETD